MEKLFEDGMSREEEIELARHLAFQDWVDGLENGESREKVTKVVDTISRLDMDHEKLEREQQRADDESKHRMEQDEERTNIERERLKLDQQRYEDEKVRKKHEQTRDDILSTMEVGIEAVSLTVLWKEFKGMIYLSNQPRIVDRLSMDALKEFGRKSMRNLRFRR